MAKEFQYGAYYLQIIRRDDAGYPVAPNSADGTTLHASVIQALDTFTHPQPTFELVTDRGGQKIRGQADLGVSAFGEGNFVLTELDDVFHALITGGAVDTTTVTGWRQTGFNVNKVTKPRFKMIVSAKTLEIDEVNNTETDKWIHHIYNNVQIRPVYPNLSQSGGVNPNTLNYTFVPSPDSRHITGELLSAMSMSLEENKDLSITMVTSKPITVTSYVEAGTPAGTFTTAYRPATSEATTTDKYLTDNGVNASITTFSTTTGVITFTALDASDKAVLVFETDFVAV